MSREELILKINKQAARCVDNNEIERIRAVQNRMVLFDSAQLHRISNVYKGERYNLATALWKETPDFFAECENWSVGGQSEKLQYQSRPRNLWCNNDFRKWYIQKRAKQRV